MGPSLDLVVRRSHLASDDLMKQACRQPKATKVVYCAPVTIIFVGRCPAINLNFFCWTLSCTNLNYFIGHYPVQNYFIGHYAARI